jgi:hypothetical protein
MGKTTPREKNMNEPAERAKRPLAITLICILGFFGVAFSIPVIFVGAVRQMGPWYSVYQGLCVLVGGACMFGLWMMKKWAAFLYAGFAALNQVILLLLGMWSLTSLVLPALVAVVALLNVRKMN